MSNPSGPPQLPPHVQVIQMATASWISAIIYAAAKLDLADHLAGGPKTATELAGPTKTHAPSLHRLMRSLANIGILTHRGPDRFALTPLGEALETGAPGSAKGTVLTIGGPMAPASWEVVHSVRTGETACDKVFGAPFFEYLAKHPEEASLFSEAMVGFHGEEPPAVARAYDFSECKTIVDVGGATGNLLAAILSTHPGPRGILFDQAHVVTDAPALLAARGIAERVSIQSGSFFDSVPAGGDTYLLSHIIHDWGEAECLTILGNCRKAMGGGGKLLLVEMVLPEGDTPHPGKLLDIIMLVIPGGRERTEAEYRVLLEKGGFRLTRVVPTASPVSVVEAVPS